MGLHCLHGKVLVTFWVASKHFINRLNCLGIARSLHVSCLVKSGNRMNPTRKRGSCRWWSKQNAVKGRNDCLRWDRRARTRRGIEKLTGSANMGEGASWERNCLLFNGRPLLGNAWAMLSNHYNNGQWPGPPLHGSLDATVPTLLHVCQWGPKQQYQRRRCGTFNSDTVKACWGNMGRVLCIEGAESTAQWAERKSKKCNKIKSRASPRVE